MNEINKNNQVVKTTIKIGKVRKYALPRKPNNYYNTIIINQGFFQYR